jgi:hypothetical protein
MTDTRRKRQDGIKTLADIKGRCVIDSETGCWLWRGAMSTDGRRKGQPTSRVWIPQSQHTPGGTTTAPRAAWMLSGRELSPEQIVWRHVCGNAACINPAHGKAGTRQDMFADLVACGRLRGDPRRAAINARNRASQLVSVERVRQAEALFAGGWLQKDIVKLMRIGNDTAAKIRRGLHPNCAKAPSTVPVASVFGWRGRIAIESEARQ